MKHVVLLLIFVAGAAHARSLAHAYPFVLPRQTVPEGGVLYVFFPTESCSDDPAELAAGQRKMLEEFRVETTEQQALPFDLKLVSRGKAFDVFSLKVTAEVDTEFVVRPVQPHHAITVVKREKQTPLKLELRPGGNDNFTDEASSERLRRLVPSLDAPAFRVTWRSGSIVIPGRVLYSPRHVAKTEVLLGDLYCGGTTAWWTSPTEFTVTALMADGREVQAAPVLLEAPSQAKRRRTEQE